MHAGEQGLRRTALLVRVVLVQWRYTLSYVATGFLVSGPIQIGLRHEGNGAFYKSVLLGLIFLAPALLLLPLTRVDWHLMRLPEFKVLERHLARWSLALSVAFLLVCFVVEWVTRSAAEGASPSFATWLCDRHVAWINVSLMGFALVRTEVDAWLFPEFYALAKDDQGLVLYRSSAPRPVEVPRAAAEPPRAVGGAPDAPSR